MRTPNISLRQLENGNWRATCWIEGLGPFRAVHAEKNEALWNLGRMLSRLEIQLSHGSILATEMSFRCEQEQE